VSEHRARFSVGQVVHHRLFDYRGIIFDVDATFEGTDAWYEEIATSRPPKDRPWYHVLVDGETHTTYVAEQNLEPSSDDEEIEHPLFEELFHRDAAGNWIPQQDIN
jgi:heat shock protein HspQ